MQVPGHIHQDVLGEALEAGGDIAMPLVDFSFRLPGRAEEVHELLAVHPGSLIETEIAVVHPETAVGLYLHHLFEHVQADGLAVTGQPHHLAFAPERLESQEGGDSRVQQAERVGVVDLLEHIDFDSFAPGVTGGGVLPHPVHHQDGRLGKRRHQKGAGRVGQMMFDEQHLSHIPHIFLYLHGQDEAFLEPRRHGVQEVLQGKRPGAQVLHDHPGELEKRLLVESHQIYVVDADLSRLQAVVDGVDGKGGGVLIAGEPLLLGRRHHLAVADQADRRVVIITGYSQYVHGYLTYLFLSIIHYLIHD